MKPEKERIEANLKTASIFQKINSKGETHKINPYSYCLKHENSDCDAALLRLKERIPVAIEKISVLIDEIPCASDVRKQFYKESIEYRYKYGLLRAIEDLTGQENNLVADSKEDVVDDTTKKHSC